ncbi:hypothetical protein DID75_02950 [Candidatus Marinamargulisbacteria bacterium SCGC AG-410-N11]|nr:hypothetical protein DID75_02950 [Candidatus Marinamargulisbacteria bacterium SCGC AG-410-N11]
MNDNVSKPQDISGDIQRRLQYYPSSLTPSSKIQDNQKKESDEKQDPQDMDLSYLEAIREYVSDYIKKQKNVKKLQISFSQQDREYQAIISLQILEYSYKKIDGKFSRKFKFDFKQKKFLRSTGPVTDSKQIQLYLDKLGKMGEHIRQNKTKLVDILE